MSEINIITPQFDRDDGLAVTYRPKGAADLDRIKQLPHEDMIKLGLGVWEHVNDCTHYLFPAEWYDCIPDGYLVTFIDGSTEPFVRGETDDDRRFGMLPFGWIVRRAVAK